VSTRAGHAAGVHRVIIEASPIWLEHHRLKRLFDVAVSSVLLIGLGPVIAVLLLAVRATSSGPALFRQERVGRSGSSFICYKIRTMQMDAPAGPTHLVSTQHVTPLGAYLRKYKLDELPQLYNVLKGEMSLVGPRPHALAHDERFAEVFARYRSRHQVKPGITGLAQVEGYRGEITTPQMLAHRIEKDIEYLNAWSLWKDLAIIARTPLSCLKSETAY